jgi:hypothetical protein
MIPTIAIGRARPLKKRAESFQISQTTTQQKITASLASSLGLKGADPDVDPAPQPLIFRPIGNKAKESTGRVKGGRKTTRFASVDQGADQRAQRGDQWNPWRFTRNRCPRGFLSERAGAKV